MNRPGLAGLMPFISAFYGSVGGVRRQSDVRPASAERNLSAVDVETGRLVLLLKKLGAKSEGPMILAPIEIYELCLGP